MKKLRKKIKKACGPDGITNWMLVWTGPNTISALLALPSVMWQRNLLPTGLGDVSLRYIPKGTKPAHEISGYRSISLTSCIGKLYTMVWLPKLTSKLFPWIGRHQGAFQKGTGALEQAWMCMEMIREKVKAGGEAHMALTDLENAMPTFGGGACISFHTPSGLKETCPGTSNCGSRARSPPLSGAGLSAQELCQKRASSRAVSYHQSYASPSWQL